MKERGYAGSFTVYFSLILLSGVTLFLGILWVTRYRIEKNDALRMTQVAGNSVLSCYSKELADRYGLFGTEVSQLEQRTQDFLKMNEKLPKAQIYSRPSYLMSPLELWEGIFTYQVKDVTVTNVSTLGEKQRFQEQIRQFMQYRFAQEILLECMESLQGVVAGSGIRAQYARIQNVLMEYNSIYAELVKCLYPEGHQEVYVNITREQEYSPERLYGAVRDLQYDDIQKGTDWEVLALWQEDGQILYEQNQRAAEYTAQIQEHIGELNKELAEWQKLLDGMSEEEKKQAQSTIDGVENIKGQVWGLRGEAAELQKILLKNQMLTENLSESCRSLLELDSTGEEIGEEQWQRMEDIAGGFLEYDGDIVLEYTKTSNNSKWDLKGIWNWIQSLKIDLEKYGADEYLLEETELISESDLIESVHRIEQDCRDGMQTVLDKIYLVEYGMGMFKNLSDQRKAEEGELTYNLRGHKFAETLFKNEGEFLLQGSGNEYKNLQGTQLKIIGIRLIMNMMYLMGSPEKQEMIQLAAQSTGGIIAPGVGTGIAYGAILFLWSAAEAYVDYYTLYHDGKIPLLKDDDSWQVDLESVLEKVYKIQEREEQEGLDYEMYLRLLLLLTDQDLLSDRLQMLIQLNLQKDGIEGFMLSDMAVSFDVTTKIQGKTGVYITGEGFQYE